MATTRKDATSVSEEPIRGGTTPDVSLTQDESFTETDHRGLTYPLGNFGPQTGDVHWLRPSVGWTRMPMPGSLAHINCWVLPDGDGRVMVVDTGLKLPDVKAGWDAVFSGPLAGQSINRILCTHFHPDHIGSAGGLSRAHGNAPLWMTRGEWYAGAYTRADIRDAVPDEVNEFRRHCGWSPEQVDAAATSGWGMFQFVVSRLPYGYRRIVDGEVIPVGKAEWRVVVGNGHSPEHACLLNERDGLLIAGDQVLPKISSNVSVGAGEPDIDALGDWLSSIDKLLTLDAGLLVLPAHGEPFTGLHTRLHALRDEHLQRLDELAAWCAQAPRRVVDCFKILFRRPIEQEHLFLASGEALAHLRRLEVSGRVQREARDGQWWFSAI